MKVKPRIEDVLRTKVFYFYCDHFDEKVTFALAVDKQNKIRIAAAVCSPLDQFNKKIGRAIATGRILTGKDCLIADNLLELTDQFGDLFIKDRDFDIDPFAKLVDLARSGKYDLGE